MKKKNILAGPRKKLARPTYAAGRALGQGRGGGGPSTLLTLPGAGRWGTLSEVCEDKPGGVPARGGRPGSQLREGGGNGVGPAVTDPDCKRRRDSKRRLFLKKPGDVKMWGKNHAVLL